MRQIIEIAYEVMCFLLYFLGVYHLISFLKRYRPVILYYHSVNRLGYQYVYPDNVVSVENFEKQVKYLSRKKQMVSLSDLAKYLEGDIDFPPNIAVITFDDGYSDFYPKAYPILKKYKVPCTLFPITELLDKGGMKWEDVLAYRVNTTEAKSLTISIKGKTRAYGLKSPSQKLSCIRDLSSIMLKMSETERCETLSEIESQLNHSCKSFEPTMLSWKEALELNKDNLISFGSHTHSHCKLTKVSPQKAELEISKSKEIIERFLGKPCVLFSYPMGKKDSFNKHIMKMLRAKGFLLAVTTLRGGVSKKSDPFELKRIAAINDASYKFKCSLIGITLQRS